MSGKNSRAEEAKFNPAPFDQQKNPGGDELTEVRGKSVNAKVKAVDQTERPAGPNNRTPRQG